MGILTKKSADNEARLTRELVIMNRYGLHARPAAMFVKTSNRFKSEVWVEKDGEEVNGKSIMGLMMLGAAMGTSITVEATGPEAEQALDALSQLVASKFDED